MENIITLENDTLKLGFDRKTGCLVAATAVESGWQVLNRPQVGLSFRLLVPLSEDRRNNPVFGEKQALAHIEASEDHKRAIFVWDGVDSEVGGHLAIKLTLEVSLDQRGAVFAMTVENHTPYIVENVYCPYLGDIQPPPAAEFLKSFSSAYGTATEFSIWPTYQNLRGYFGVDYPIQFATASSSVGTPMTPYILLRSQDQGLYAGVTEPSAELVAWHTELRPGYGSSIDEIGRAHV